MASAALRRSQLVFLAFFFSLLQQGESCGGNLTASSGTVKSPNYPNSYGNSLSCTWMIIGPNPSSRISLSISLIRLETPSSGTNTCYDYVMFQSIDENGQLVEYNGLYCGTYSDVTINSSTHILKVNFKSDSSVSSNGFTAKYTISNYFTPSTTTPRPCTQDEITCPNGRCISPQNLCDGVNDCLDHWDENCWRASWNKTGVYQSLFRGHSFLVESFLASPKPKDMAKILTTFQLASKELHAFPAEENSFLNISAHIFESELSTAFLRNDTDITEGHGLALSIIALKAICSDPQNFHGLNLTARLTSVKFNEDGPLASVALCISDLDLPEDYIHGLKNIAMKKPQNNYEFDRKATAVIALVCAHRRGQLIPEKDITELAKELVAHQYSITGAFVGVHSSALIGQALLALRSDFNVKWRFFSLIEYLKSKEKTNGGFGSPDIETTALVLPVLTGRSYPDLMNTSCPAVTPLTRSPKVDAEPMLRITFSIWLNDDRNLNTTTEYEMPATLNATFFDFFKTFVVQKYSANWDMQPWGPSIYSFKNVFNDPQYQIYWRLFQFLNGRIPQRIHKRIDQVYLQDGGHYVLWYTSTIQ